MYAEFAGYCDENELSYYQVNASVFNIIFTGPEGGSGYIDPPITKSFTADYQFGLSMLSPDGGGGTHRYFTETSRNGDGIQHAKIFENLDDPGMFLIGFENLWGGGDKDYNDMVLSLKPKQPPVACFTVSNESPNVCETVTFNATCSYDPDGTIVKYEWDWEGDCLYDYDAGDNPIAAHHYDTHGTYYPKLRVTDNDGLTDETNKTILVRAHPVACFTWTPEKPQVCETVTFNASASTPDGGVIVSWDWNFGDNTTGSGEIVTHHYDNYGNYTVTLNVTDSEGKWDTESKTVTVREHPQADFTWSPLSPQVGETVTFNASTSTPNGGTIVSYIWDFGDSNSGTGKIANHTYATFGNYTVSLNVTDSEGKWDVVSKNITVRAHPHAEFSWSPPSPKVCEMVTFNASASTPDGGTIISYEWSFGDGNITIIGDDEPITPIITHHYTAPGDYNVTLTVTDSENKSDTTWKMITVTPQKHYLTVQTDPANITTIPGEGWYDNCTYVTLTAPEFVPDEAGVGGERYRFDRWTVNSGVYMTLSITVHMDANYTATAHYAKQYYLTVTSPYGTPSGEGWYDECTDAYAGLDTGGVPGPTGTQYVFVQWTRDASGSDYAQSDAIHMDAPKTAIAEWKTQYYLTVVSAYGTPGGEGWYDESDTAYATITPLTVSGPTGVRYVFIHWSGDASGTSSPSGPIIMDGPKTAVANWKTQYLLTVRTDPTGLSPQPTRSPAGGAGPGGWWYDNCTEVVLKAQPVTGYTFLNWDVDGFVDPNNPITVHMHAPHTATAHYEAPPPPPPAPAVGGEMILVKGDQPVAQLPIDLVCLLVAAVGVAVVLMSVWKKGRQ